MPPDVDSYGIFEGAGDGIAVEVRADEITGDEVVLSRRRITSHENDLPVVAVARDDVPLADIVRTLPIRADLVRTVAKAHHNAVQLITETLRPGHVGTYE